MRERPPRAQHGRMTTPTEPAGQAANVAGETRIGDVEREQAIRRLTASVGSGHLTVEEADQRISRVYEARWPSQLNALLGDLPPVGATVNPPAASQPPQPPRPRARVPLFPVILLAFGLTVFLGPILHQWVLPTLPLLLGGLLLVRWNLNNQQRQRS